MPDDRGRMTADEFRAALALLDLSQSAFARLLVDLGDTAGDKERTVQRWATGQQDIPGPIMALLKVLAVVAKETLLDLDDVVQWAPTILLPSDAQTEGEAQIVEDRRKR